MSAAALSQAVRDTLIARIAINGAALTEDTCEIGFTGQPKPASGQYYFAIHMASWAPGRVVGESDWDLTEDISVSVTVTLKLGDTPEDRYGIAVWVKQTTGLDALVRSVIAVIHQNQAVRALANTSPLYGLSLDGVTAGFHTTTVLTGAQPPQFRDWKWFTAGLPKEAVLPEEMAQAGVSQTVTFKASRCQAIPLMN